MAGFDGRKIEIPPDGLWSQDWEAALALRSGEDRQIILLRKKLAGVLGGLSTAPASAERLAWMIFWTRAVSLSKATLTAFDSESELMLTVLQRMSLEMVMQFRLIVEPLSQATAPDREAKWRVVVDRLRAYTTWCIWADRNVLKQMIHPHGVRDAFDTSTARQLLNDPEMLKFVENNYLDGGASVYRVAQAEDTARVKRELNRRFDGLEQLLKDWSCTQWASKLQQANNAKPKLNLLFFELFGESGEKKSMGTLMDDFHMLFAYHLYSSGSLAIHGGSLDQFLTTNDDGSWRPRVLPSSNQCLRTALAIVGWCEGVCDFLNLTKAAVWQVGIDLTPTAGGRF